ncbi:uroporphyrinogen-III synthase [Vibrio hannami]|uniref:uroporphyrinogen-III synthase n=1 Tax=Vibrio hannami TaxID=2717094 RepID=UPI00240F0B86|nr:uroporphyrinogen-III synthase [Vibrio hannami]MDG3086684.1 uroporphyrinogen-III synthase [Vibrio hannami]
MNAVIVTRPSPEGEALCESLEGVGIQAFHLPLISFIKGAEAEGLPSLLKSSDIVIAVSKPAVEWAHRILCQYEQDWPEKLRYLAIGQKTADELSKCTQQEVHYPEVSDSEHFLKLPLLERVHDKKVLILRGNGGRELIRDKLSGRGAIVNYCEVYQRQTLVFNGHSEIEKWQRNNIDSIVVTSADQLTILMKAVPENYHHWLCTRTLLVPSYRIAEIASEFGFASVKVTGSASNSELLTTIQSFSTTGLTHDK